jgi:hypothetical protein
MQPTGLPVYFHRDELLILISADEFRIDETPLLRGQESEFRIKTGY